MESKLIREYIKEIIDKNKEQKRLVNKYIIFTLIRSCIIYGSKHKITEDCCNIYNLFKDICKRENSIYYFILKNSTNIDYGEFCDLIDRLEILNDNTVTYIYSMLDDIDDACDTKQEIRANHAKKKFDYIIDNDNYFNEALGLVISDKDIKDFLDYDEEFWEYVKTRTRKIDSRGDKKNIFYNTVLHFDNNKKLDDMRVYVPNIINLKTALINVHEFKHANDLYKELGSSISDNVEPYEISARKKEDEFVKTYLPKINK